MTKKLTLTKASEQTTKGFVQAVQEEYVKKYAQDVVQMLEDKKKLERALAKVTKWIAKVEDGDYEAIEQYKKARRRLSEMENAEFE